MRHEEKVVCANCGATFITRKKDGKYCSWSCANRHKRAGSGTKESEEFILCHYNQGVVCRQAKCESCGWNPMVSERRSEKILQKFKEAMA